MEKFLYGVESSYSGMEMNKTRIKKETPKTYRVESYIGPYNTIQVNKDHPFLAFSASAAVEIFIHNNQEKIKLLEDRIVMLKSEIENARQLTVEK